MEIGSAVFKGFFEAGRWAEGGGIVGGEMGGGGDGVRVGYVGGGGRYVGEKGRIVGGGGRERGGRIRRSWCVLTSMPQERDG